MEITSFKKFVVLKESSTDWRSATQGPPLEKGFIPPTKLRPIIRAFLNSDKITLMHDTSEKPITMPKKTLYLVGGPVRDFIKGKSIKDLDLATNATPEQIATILTAAGFKRTGDRGGASNANKQSLHLPSHFWNADSEKVDFQDSDGNDKKIWYVKGHDTSGKAFVIGAVVDGEEFDIATFRKDAKTENGKSSVDFVDNPKDDADRRDLTINSMYIELNKPDGENKTLYDPTKTGLHDLQNNIVKTVGKAQDRFEEDPIRVMRAIRFHCRFSDSEALHPEIAKAIPNFLNLHERVALDRIRDEFLKGLLSPDVDSSKYISIYKKTGLLKAIFPGLVFDAPNGVPQKFTDKKDKALALAFLLQHNPIDKVSEALSDKRVVSNEEKQTGWQSEERKAVLFLLKLKEFTPDQIAHFMKNRAGTGLSNRQIHDWVDMFKIDDSNRHRRPWWAKQVKAFADHNRKFNWKHVEDNNLNVCPNCRGKSSETCKMCKGSGQYPIEQRGALLDSLETNHFKKLIGNNNSNV